MKTKLRFLFVVSIISLSVVFSTTGRIFFNDNYGVAFGAPPSYETAYWCGQYGGSCPTPVINDYYVDDDSPNDPGSGTKLDPYRKIVYATNAASSGNTIHVAGGTYPENLIISKTVTLEGGWDGTFSQRDISLNVTIIDGSGDTKSVIKLFNNNPTIDGFTITGGNSLEYEGGGIFIDSGSPYITNNIITQNNSDEQGGGIYIDYASPTITNNTITGNHGGELGGGIMLRAALPNTLITKNIISNNSAEEGGGICNYFTSNVVTNNIIVDNTAVEGGGIYLYGALNQLNTCHISNNTITDNTASSGNGGGIYVDFDAYPTITNTILWGNGDELYVTPGESVFISFSDIDDVNYNGPNNNISADPLFNVDYSLNYGSPAIDTGKNTSSSTYGSVVDDIIGTLRPQDGASGNTGDMSDYDMGAYEMPAMQQAYEENNPDDCDSLIKKWDDINDPIFTTNQPVVAPTNPEAVTGRLDPIFKSDGLTSDTTGYGGPDTTGYGGPDTIGYGGPDTEEDQPDRFDLIHDAFK